MFDEWKFERKLAKLQRQQAEIYANYKKEKAAALAVNNHERELEARSDASNEHQLIQADIDDLVTDYLVRTANSLLIPVSSKRTTSWEQNLFGEPKLTLEAVNSLRNDIHEELKKRVERRTLWLGPIANIITLLIALGGLIVAILALRFGKP